MKIPTFKKSCCYLDLTIGAAIIGWLGSIYALLDITVTIYQLTGADASLDLKTVVFIVLSLIWLVVSGCLMMATQSENRRLVIPWLVITIFNLIATNTMFFYFDVGTVADFSLLILLIWNLVFIYVWLCVYSYYCDLKNGY